MALGAKPFTATVAMTGATNATLVASPASGINRYVKQIKVVNGGPACSYTMGLKATTTSPAAGDANLIALQRTLDANKDYDHSWAGDGLEWKAASALNLNGGASVASQVTIHVIGYEVPA